MRRTRPTPRSSQASTPPLQRLLSEPSLIAVGFDPRMGGSVHLLIRTNGRDIRRTKALSAEYRVVLQCVQGLLENSL
jgi:hypothetical protein